MKGAALPRVFSTELSLPLSRALAISLSLPRQLLLCNLCTCVPSRSAVPRSLPTRNSEGHEMDPKNDLHGRSRAALSWGQTPAQQEGERTTAIVRRFLSKSPPSCPHVEPVFATTHALYSLCCGTNTCKHPRKSYCVQRWHMMYW